MIDINKAKEVYKNYIKNYNPENPKIALKIAHIYRTAQKAKELAIKLGLSEEDIKLAELIGMLHDIGRFEQVKRFNTFVDIKSVNHGEYGVKVLFEDGLIKEFVQDRNYDEIIYKAVINHNRNKIEEGLDERTLLHCKIIRDADKLDILYIQTFEDIEAIYDSTNVLEEEITPVILEQYINNHKINYKDRRNVEDILISHIAFIFNIYFKETMQEIKKEEYIKKMIDRFEFNNKELKKQMKIVYDIATEYINNKLLEE